MTARRSILEFDVARDQWASFLAQFSGDHRSELATVERCDSGGTSNVIARERPLANVTVDDACGLARAVHIAFTGADGKSSGYLEVPDPIALRRVEAPDDVPFLEIHQAGGGCTRLRFGASVSEASRQ